MSEDEHKRRKESRRHEGFWGGMIKGDHGAAMNALGFGWPGVAVGDGLTDEQFLALTEECKKNVITKIEESRLLPNEAKIFLVDALKNVVLGSPASAGEMRALCAQVKNVKVKGLGLLLFRKISDFDLREIERDLLSLERACSILNR